jgi:adenylate cyclase
MAANPDEPRALCAKAAVARWRGDIDASHAAAAALARSHDFGIGLYFNAEVTLLMGGPGDALGLMERAVRLNPGMSYLHLQLLSQAHLLLHYFETAVVVLRERTYVVRETDIGRAWLAATRGHLGEMAEVR